MDTDGRSIGRLVTGIGGGALTTSVFLTWYSLNLGALLQSVARRLPDALGRRLANGIAAVRALTITSSGWHAVHMLRFVLLLVGLLALLTAFAPTAIEPNVRGRLLILGGLLAAALTLYRIASPPGALGVSFGPF